MRKLLVTGAFVALLSLAACDRTGEGQYEVEKPVIGTETDTVETPTVETGTVRDTIKVPDVDVTTEKREVKVPKVEVNEPGEN